MKLHNNLFSLFVGSSLVLATGIAQAEVETTTIKTTTYKDGLLPPSNTTETRTIRSVEPKTIVLPGTVTYTVIDPLTGEQRGVLDPMRSPLDIKTIIPGSIIVDRVTGKIVATVSTSGQTIDVISAPAIDTLISAIDGRRAELDNMINRAQSEGSINATQSVALRAALDKITTRENLAKQATGFLTYSEALSLALELNSLSDRIVLMSNQKTIITPIIGSRIINTNGQLLMVDDITFRRINLGQRVEDEYLSGRLSSHQVADLNEELNDIASLDSKYRKNGELSSSHADKIASKLNTVQSHLDKDVAVINDKRAKIGIRVE